MNQIIEKLKIIPIELTKTHVYGKVAEEESAGITLDSSIQNAIELKQYLNHEWKYLPGSFPLEFENYTKGWNASVIELEEAKKQDKMLFLNIDLEDNGCSRNCSHCFTMGGQIDSERGRKTDHISVKLPRKKLTSERLIKQIQLAKDKLGLKSVRILGRGEPTESPALLQFVETMHQMDLTTLIFTRGHVIGNDNHARLIFGKHGISSGVQLAERLYAAGASIVCGYSALHANVHDGMVGIADHSRDCKRGLRRLMDVGFNEGNPTRLGIEAPVGKMNMNEFPVSYTLFQCLGISPIYNAYMVTGHSNEEFFQKHNPSYSERLRAHALIQHTMIGLGINDEIGAYLGTKKCHDVERGLYIPSNGLVRPCPGYESADSIKGDLNIDSIEKIWEYSKIMRPQHICEPKVTHGFPLSYIDDTQETMREVKKAASKTFQAIADQLFQI